MWDKLSGSIEKAFSFEFTAYILNIILFLDFFLIVYLKSSILQIDSSFYSSTSSWILFVFSYLIICSVFLPAIWNLIILALSFLPSTNSRPDYQNTMSKQSVKERAAEENNSVLYDIYKQFKNERDKEERIKVVYFSLAILLILNLCFLDKSILGSIINVSYFIQKLGMSFTILLILFLLSVSFINIRNERDRIFLRLKDKNEDKITKSNFNPKY